MGNYKGNKVIIKREVDWASTSLVKQGKLIEQALPALLYADDIVLMADNKEDLQRFVDICGNEGDMLDFRFSEENQQS